jgi:hypothetical protein
VINTGLGNDTINLTAGATFATVLPTTTTEVINGGSGTDTLAFAGTLGAGEGINLQTYVTNGTLVSIEGFSVTATNANNSTHAITMATGITSLALNSDDGDEIYNVTGTSVQIDALTSVTNASATGQLNLIVSDAASLSFVGDTLTNVDVVNFGSTSAGTVATGASAIAVTQTGTGSAATTYTVGSATTLTATAVTTANNAQTLTAVSTGTVTFNVPFALMQEITGVDNSGAYDAGDITLVSATAAATTLNFTGAATTAVSYGGATTNDAVGTVLLTDTDLLLTVAQIDNINVGGVSSNATFSYGTGLIDTTNAGTTNATSRGNIPVVATESTATQYTYTFVTDNAGTANTTLAITGFDAGTGGDKLLLSNAANAIGASSVFNIAITGFTVGADAAVAAGAEAQIMILGTAAAQISGPLTQVANAGAVEAAIIAGGFLTATTSDITISTYVVLDNGTDTGIYRVVLDNATNNAATAIDTAGEITSVVLVGQLTGIADASTLNSANFA